MLFRSLVLTIFAVSFAIAQVIVTETSTVYVCVNPTGSNLPTSSPSSQYVSPSGASSGGPSSQSSSPFGGSQSSGKASSATSVVSGTAGPTSPAGGSQGTTMTSGMASIASGSSQGGSSSKSASTSTALATSSGAQPSMSGSSSIKTSSMWYNSTSASSTKSSAGISTGASSGLSSMLTSTTSKVNSSTTRTTTSTIKTNSTASASSMSSTVGLNSTMTSISSTSTMKANSTTSSTCTAPPTPTGFVNQTVCNGQTYTYQQLAGYGFNPANARDEFGDTIGGIGSAIALDRTKWTKLPNGSYTGMIWALPDRGWNTEGTLNYQPRVHLFSILLVPQPCATVSNPSGPNIFFSYQRTVKFWAPDGVTPTTGIDADGSGHISYPGFPDLPIATFSGDGFGGPGPVHRYIPIDAEGLHLNDDGSFWVSDEYGPYVYKFDSSGKMIAAVRPNDAIIPMRNNTESFSADSQYYYVNNGTGDDVNPPNNPTGRDNNHGFEGLTFSGDGNTMYVLLQAAANQEGGLASQTERYTRFVKYDVSVPSAPAYLAEYVVPLPPYNDPTAKASKNPKTAAQSEIFHLTGEQFFVLARDSNAGHGQASSLSVYRHADVFDISSATNTAQPQYDCTNCSIASLSGVLNSAITPATYCPFLDYNVNSQLNRFGVHNGGAQDQYLLNEKWESLGLVPVDGVDGADGEFFLFSLSDNNFITQDGYLDGGLFHYVDASGYNLDCQALVFQVKLPTGVNPFSSP